MRRRLPARHVRAANHARHGWRRLATVESELARLESEQISDAEIKAALADFGAVWEVRQPREQAGLIELLVETSPRTAHSNSVTLPFSRSSRANSLESGN